MYKMMFVAGTVLAVIFLIVSVVLFLRNDVPQLIRGITGRNTRKTIKQMAEEAVTVKLCSETKTGPLPKKQEESTSEIFKVLEDITEFYGKEENSEKNKI